MTRERGGNILRSIVERLLPDAHPAMYRHQTCNVRSDAAASLHLRVRKRPGAIRNSLRWHKSLAQDQARF